MRPNHPLRAARISWIGLLACLAAAPALAAEPEGLVGRWEFDDGTGADLSGRGAPMRLGDAQLHPLGGGRRCLRLNEEGQRPRIPASPDSPLAIRRGTICMWMNVAWSDRANALAYDNGAVQFRIYRRHLQPYFKGEQAFEYGANVIDYDWPKYDMREWAFYPHVKAAVRDSEWHHFAVAYDDREKQIIGWRDGERIAVVDLSATPMTPLVRDGLTQIVVGEDFVGFLDDIRIYNRALSGDEVRAVYEATRTVYEGRDDTIPTDRKMVVYQYREEDRTLYRAWLQYAPSPRSRRWEALRRIVAEGDHPTVQNAARELRDAAASLFGETPALRDRPGLGPQVVLGEPETSAWIRERADQLGLDRVRHDGFVIKTLVESGRLSLVVAGRVPAGVMFGVFELVRRLQFGQDPARLDVLENPAVPIRMVDHWSNFRGFRYDNWRSGGRDNSIYSWRELRTGDTKRIRDWVRLMASAGWNAICPSEVNWSYRNNFLEHLDEVETLAAICREYGVRLYWSPSYLLALDPKTAEAIYRRVPDFGGYVLKLGSEKQNGDPRPPMVNRIADTLKPYGGYAIVRAFVYGNYRYTPEPYRNLIPYDLFAAEDGNFRDNVIVTPKSSPMDWDFWAPIPALDGALQKTLSGSEWVIDKSWPVSWVEKWKWWLEQDHRRRGPGSLNKFDADCIMGVSMISPSPAWTDCPLNLVNYYGQGRLAWNPDLSVDEIYTEWIRQTFGDDPEVLRTIKTILLISDDVTRKLYRYRGYRGIWFDRGDEGMVEHKTPYVVNKQGMGIKSPALQRRVLAQYASELRQIYGDRARGEAFLTAFHFVQHDERLSNGRTLIQDVYANMDEAVELAERMVQLWKRLEGRIDPRRFQYTLEKLTEYVTSARSSRDSMAESFERHTGRKRAETLAALAPERLAAAGVFNVRHFGAVGDGLANEGPAFRRAIQACRRNQGGVVFVPTGVYRCGTIRLGSGVTLSLDAGAVLQAAPGSTGEGLVVADRAENVRIFGPGVLDASAFAGRDAAAVSLRRCRNVQIRNLTVRQRGPAALRAVGCAGLVLDNLNVHTGGDGLVLAGCRDVRAEYCRVDAVRRQWGRPVGGGDAVRLAAGGAAASEGVTLRHSCLEGGARAMELDTDHAAPLRNVRLDNVRILKRPGGGRPAAGPGA